MSRLAAVLALLASSALASASAQPAPGVTRHGREIVTEYDSLTDSTTRSISAYVMVDTSAAPPDTLAVELRQRWQGRGTIAPVAAVELGLGRARPAGLSATRALSWNMRRRPSVVFLLDGVRRIRLEQDEYVSNGGATMTFETARYRLAPADLRRIAECREIRVWVGDRELWIDPAWRGVAAEMVAGQTP